MRQFAFAALFLFVGAASWGPLGSAAHADEKSEQQEDTEAARLFREGWWLETGSGALEKAAESYRKAVAAAGSQGIRARAQYRLALVLERMGRTEQAVRALEALAAQFSDQTEFLARARTKLEAWSGEDLREHFADWYQRFQYSPTFQSKIVDLVLQLGTGDRKVSSAASQELLTIGAPALPALRAHVTSANSLLRQAVVGLMVRLKELPSPEALFRTPSYRSTQNLWNLVADLQEPARGKLAAAARELPEDPRARSVLAVLAGPSAMIDRIAKSTNDRLVSYFWTALKGSNPSAQDLERLREIPGDRTVAGSVRGNVARYVAYAHDWKGEKADPTGFETADLLAWAGSDEPTVREVVWRLMKATSVRDVEAWRVPARWLAEASGPTSEHHEVVSALLGQLRLVPDGTDVQLAVDGLVRTLDQGTGIDRSPQALRLSSVSGVPGSAATPRRVYAQAIGRAKGKQVGGMPQSWWQITGGDPTSLGTLIGWIGSAADGQVRSGALRVAAREIRTGVPRLMVPFGDARRRQELHQVLFQNLANNPALAGLDWDRESLTRLVEAGALEVQELAGSSRFGGHNLRRHQLTYGGVRLSVLTRLSGSASNVFYSLLQVDALREEFLAAAATAPERVTPDIWPLLGNEWSSVPENRALALSFLERGWAQWSAEQKPAGLNVFFPKELIGRGDAALNAFLRRALTNPTTTLEVRQTAALAISDLKLADVASAFDLNQPKQAEVGVRFLGYLPDSAETYAAFKHLLGAQTTSKAVVSSMANRFGSSQGGTRSDLIEGLLAVPPGLDASKRALHILHQSGVAKDLPLWRVALKHPETRVRTAAATALGNLYDDESIRALARVVDDPDPEVRDAALKSLERIETIEKQKAHWRKFAEEK